jgi:WD40 repeat protein
MGHTTSVTSGEFSPIEKNIAATGSLDSTVRIWDILSSPYGIEKQLVSKHVMKFRDSRG